MLEEAEEDDDEDDEEEASSCWRRGEPAFRLLDCVTSRPLWYGSAGGDEEEEEDVCVCVCVGV